MTERHFRMRLSCRYEEPKNAVTDLRVEHLEKDEWKPLDLGLGSPGFQVFVYAIFTCQHLYMRTNCAERGIALDSAQGHIHVTAGDDWTMSRLHLGFDARVRSGEPSDADVDYVVGRMRQCPASINLREVADAETVLRLS
ncbi:MAG: hypothetical protein PVF91_10005 [Chromatiales bacterium]|jgi:hypothetical protein